jgi:guanylate kinase
MEKGIIFVITAPSGCGKGSLRRLALDEVQDICFCPSLTTRAPRAGEVDREDYCFVSKDEFFEKKNQGLLEEWAEVYGNYYGTPSKDIQDCLARGLDVLLEKDVQGARTLRRLYPEGVFIFVLPPSLEELRRRIESRGTESEEQRDLRFKAAQCEMADLSVYDYVIINADLNRAKDRLLAIIAGERARRSAEATPLQRRALDGVPTPGSDTNRIQVQSSGGRSQEGEADSVQEGAFSVRGSQARYDRSGRDSFGKDSGCPKEG